MVCRGQILARASPKRGRGNAYSLMGAYRPEPHGRIKVLCEEFQPEPFEGLGKQVRLTIFRSLHA